jgi:Kef-type K+ transport system membrane component KefB
LEPLPGISHPDLLKLVLSMAILLVTARLFAEIMVRIGQPAVVGEILAGVVLGPAILSGIFPALNDLLIPQTPVQGQLLDAIGLMGILLLILIVGMETDLALIRTRLKTATAVGLGGLIVPFGFGLLFGAFFPDDLLIDPAARLVFSLFLAVALALSAMPVLAKILSDLGLMRKEFGQTALAAGMIDDILGWTLFGVVTSLAAAGGLDLGSIGTTIGAIVLFLVLTVIVARPVARWSLGFVQDRMRLPYRLVTLVVVLALLWGAFTQALHLEPILGAFAVGVIFGQSRRLPVEVGQQLESVTFGVFAPIFLATAGLRLDLSVLLEPELLAITAALVVVAAVAKVAGAYIGARFFAGSPRREALAYGVALNARGVLGIIVAALGLTLGVFSREVYSMIVVVSVITSLTAPLGLKRLLLTKRHGRAVVEDRHGPLDSIRRVLLPVRVRETASPVATLEMAVLTKLGAKTPAVTLLSVVAQGGRRSATSYLGSLAKMLPPGTETTRRVRTGNPAQAIVEEAANGYDLIALGAPEAREGDEYLFDSVLDDVVRLAPCPSLIFTAREGHWPPKTILVPTGGSGPSTRAADLAFALADDDCEVVLLHVVDPETSTQMATGRSSSIAVRLEIAQNIVDAIRATGEAAGVTVSTEVIQGGSPIPVILDRAVRNVDLVIFGTNVRAGAGRLFLGPKVEQLLSQAPCSVIIYNS